MIKLGLITFMVSSCLAKSIVCYFPKDCRNPIVYSDGEIRMLKANFKVKASCSNNNYTPFFKIYKYKLKNRESYTPYIIMDTWNKDTIKCK